MCVRVCVGGYGVGGRLLSILVYEGQFLKLLLNNLKVTKDRRHHKCFSGSLREGFTESTPGREFSKKRRNKSKT